MNMNVLRDYPYRKSYYLRHPLKLWKDFAANMRNAWDRATKGYCCVDYWNMDSWLTTVLPAMLDELAEHSWGYPGDGTSFDTPEKWHRWLRQTAQKLRDSDPDDTDALNPYAEEYNKYIDSFLVHEKQFDGSIISRCTDDEEKKELMHNYFDCANTLARQRKAQRSMVMKEIIENLDYLWD